MGRNANPEPPSDKFFHIPADWKVGVIAEFIRGRAVKLIGFTMPEGHLI